MGQRLILWVGDLWATVARWMFGERWLVLRQISRVKAAGKYGLDRQSVDAIMFRAGTRRTAGRAMRLSHYAQSTMRVERNDDWVFPVRSWLWMAVWLAVLAGPTVLVLTVLL